MNGNDMDIVKSDFPTEQLAIFALVIDGDVAGTISYNENDGTNVNQRHIAAFRSGAQIVECSHIDGVRFGWTHDGTNFIRPDGTVA